MTTIEKLVQQHRELAETIMRDKHLSEQGLAQDRADQLVGALRHLICCWALSEATEAQLQQISAELGKDLIPKPTTLNHRICYGN